MEVSFGEVKEVVDTLPIGLYAHRHISLNLSATEEMSYYSPMEDSIVLSYPQIAISLKGLPDNEIEYKEVLIRSNCYHEVSHAILTPDFGEKVTPWLNILEDERIETLLKDFYLDVDFKRNILLTNGGKVTPPTDVNTAFYNTVRFRIGDEKWIDRLNTIIKEYSNVNGNGSYLDYESCWKVRSLYNAYERFWNDFCKEYKKNPNQMGGSDKSEEELNEISQNIKDGKGDGQGRYNKETTNRAKSSSDSEENGEGQGEGYGKGQGEKVHAETDCDDDANADNFGRSGDGFENGKAIYNKLFDGALNSYINSSLTATLESIISAFNKKNNGGNGICGYSGVFNPRNVARKDYRYFDKPISTNGNNKFGTFHLNLWIDCSASFHNNQDAVNVLLKSLTDIESRNKNFSLDVIFCGNGLHECPTKTKRVLVANEGNSLAYAETEQMFKKYQKANTYNYNIILFDGDCDATAKDGHYIDVYKENFSSERNALWIFDRNDCSLILEKGNENYAKGMKTAKITWCNSNYATELTEQVVKALTMAFH